MAYPRDEQETTSVYDPVDNKWIVYSSVRKHITRLLKIGGEPIWKEEEPGAKGEIRIIAAKWVVEGKQVIFSKIREAKEKKGEDGDPDEVCGD